MNTRLFGSTITLTDENDNEVSFGFLDRVDYNGGMYAVLLPKNESDYEDEVLILKADEDGGGDEVLFTGVEDEETLQAVLGIIKEKFKDSFDFN